MQMARSRTYPGDTRVLLSLWVGDFEKARRYATVGGHSSLVLGDG